MWTERTHSSIFAMSLLTGFTSRRIEDLAIRPASWSSSSSSLPKRSMSSSSSSSAAAGSAFFAGEINLAPPPPPSCSRAGKASPVWQDASSSRQTCQPWAVVSFGRSLRRKKSLLLSPNEGSYSLQE
uniref:Uncharacterized protein n=1 Tax=Calidris pygmaea TaxID=425635 RepID=A0A8C3J3K3_9CHAR